MTHQGSCGRFFFFFLPFGFFFSACLCIHHLWKVSTLSLTLVCVPLVPMMVPKTTAETLKHKINPSLELAAPQAVDVLLYTPGTNTHTYTAPVTKQSLQCSYYHRDDKCLVSFSLSGQLHNLEFQLWHQHTVTDMYTDKHTHMTFALSSPVSHSLRQTVIKLHIKFLNNTSSSRLLNGKTAEGSQTEILKRIGELYGRLLSRLNCHKYTI